MWEPHLPFSLIVPLELPQLNGGFCPIWGARADALSG